MAEGPTEKKDTWWVAEKQLWYVCAVGGLISFGVGVGGLLLGWSLVAIGWAAKLNQIGITQIGVAVLVGLFLTNFLATRLREFVLLMFIELGHLANQVGSLDEVHPSSSREFCHETRPYVLVGFGFFAVVGLGFFSIVHWSCLNTYSGGLLHVACSSFEPGLFRTLAVMLARLQYAGFGVAGALFSAGLIIELRCSWRQSRLQAAYQNGPLYGLLHPRAEFEDATQENNSGEQKADS